MNLAAKWQVYRLKFHQESEESCKIPHGKNVKVDGNVICITKYPIISYNYLFNRLNDKN